MNNMLNKIENILLIEILIYIYQPNRRFYKPVPKNIRLLMKKIHMKKYKIRYHDLNTINESLVFLNRKSIEKIFVQTYILLLEWNNDIEFNYSTLNDIFSKLGESRIEDLKNMAHKYQNGESSLEEIFTQSEVEAVESKIKTKALKLFNKFQSTDTSKINVIELNKLNKGVLMKVWGKVVKILKILNNPNIPSHIKAIAVGALLYVIIPIDAIPDYIPVGGLVDDAAVITFAFEQISKLIRNNSNNE